MKKSVIAYLVIGILVVSTMTGCVTIVKEGEEASLLSSGSVEDSISLADRWESTILPGLKEKAVDLSGFLKEAGGDISSLAEKYGKRTQADSAVSFTVKGTAEVVDINTESRAGYLEVKLDNYGGSEIIKLQIGPVFKGTAVRDSSDDIRFEDYTNQVDYAEVSKEIHDIISETIISQGDMETLKGKTIEFEGCFTLDKNEEIVITPINIVEK